MDRTVITGGKPLRGEVRTSGAKNAALPILASTILGGGECVLSNMPRVVDVVTMGKLLGMLGIRRDTRGQSHGRAGPHGGFYRSALRSRPRRCGPPCWCWVRWWPDWERPRCRFPVAVRLGLAR